MKMRLPRTISFVDLEERFADATSYLIPGLRLGLKKTPITSDIDLKVLFASRLKVLLPYSTGMAVLESSSELVIMASLS